MEKCHFCKQEFETRYGLLVHVSRKHHIKQAEYKVITEYNGEWPVCKCGCNEQVSWDPNTKEFRTYMRGHVARIHNNWGHNKKAIENSAKTRREQYKSGEREVWNKGVVGDNYIKHFDKADGSNSLKDALKSKERGDKISAALKGKQKSPEHRAKISKQLKNNRRRMKNKSSKLEDKFQTFLTDASIEHERQYTVDNCDYDFKIKNQKILIEVDGDFYHCNPQFFNEDKRTPIQRQNLKYDKIKNKIATDSGYTLLRFWEYDINNHPAKVIKELLEKI